MKIMGSGGSGEVLGFLKTRKLFFTSYITSTNFMSTPKKKLTPA